MRSWRAYSRILSGLVVPVLATAMGLPRAGWVHHEHAGGNRPHVHAHAAGHHTHAHSLPLPFAHNDDELDLRERHVPEHRQQWGRAHAADSHHSHWQQVFQTATLAKIPFVPAAQPVELLPSGQLLTLGDQALRRLRARAPPVSLIG
jgi:hypothetical protein